MPELQVLVSMAPHLHNYFAARNRSLFKSSYGPIEIGNNGYYGN